MLTLLLALVPLVEAPQPAQAVSLPVALRQLDGWLGGAPDRVADVRIRTVAGSRIYTVRLHQPDPDRAVTVARADLAAAISEAVRRWTVQDWDQPPPRVFTGAGAP